jgi:hypothetical protein
MKTAKTALATSLVFSMAFGTAHAELCYQLLPFIDVLRLAEVTIPDEATEGSHTAVFGNWTAGGFYSLPIVGSIDVTVPRATPLTFQLGLYANNQSSFFADHAVCALGGPLTGAATTEISCDGRTAGIFNVFGITLAKVSCDSVGPSSGVVGKAAGQAGANR